ncbi:MAG: 3-keto-5-aminohexanoate cleavage protein [Spirochaetes bacterium]|jgi:3-keto-5-aminohexanoate cleavage enzyme|nr:3-keto-5-aminohexanoate cleavage protein [Spirochaetota bacterium]
MEKCIITAALTGGIQGKQANPNIPYTPEEFAEEVYKCYNSGCSIVHIHCRDDQGSPTGDVKRIKETMDAIKAKSPEMIINLSTAIGPNKTKDERIAPILYCKPDMASLNTNSMNFGVVDHKTKQIFIDGIFENTFSMAVDYAKKMKEVGCKPEFEAYDLGGIYNILFFRDPALFDEPLHFQFVFGVFGGLSFDPLTFLAMKNVTPEDCTFSACGVGLPNQMPAAFMSAITGGHIRVGLEDNVRDLNKELSPGSWKQVEYATEICKLAGRTVATPAEARKILKLKSR